MRVGYADPPYVGCAYGMAIRWAESIGVACDRHWVIQHEFAPSFGLLVGLNATVGTLIMAVGPGLFGLAHDLSGSYAALFACALACNWRVPCSFSALRGLFVSQSVRLNVASVG
jgi:hypothetical protein